MKNKIKVFYDTVKNNCASGLEKARSTGLFRKSLLVIAGLTVTVTLIFVCLKVMGYLFDSISTFVDRHFFGVASTCAGCSYLFYRHNEKKLAQQKILAEQQAGLDNQRTRFVKGCYNRIGQFLYANICTAPNFSDLTSCSRPLRPDDMGNERIDAYCIQGIMYLRYALPKMTVETLDTNMISSVIQGLIDQRIKTGGLSPFISAGDNHYLYVDKVEDMKTYVSVTFVLNFDDTYIQQLAYQNAMTDIIERQAASKTFEDNDYHA